MNKFLLAIALLTAFSAPALAALEKAPARSDQRHVQSTSEPQWRGREAGSGSVRDSYWQQCNSSFHAYIVNNCD